MIFMIRNIPQKLIIFMQLNNIAYPARPLNYQLPPIKIQEEELPPNSNTSKSHQSKKIRKQHARGLQWDVEEHLKYVVFLKKNIGLFDLPSKERKCIRSNKLMSEAVGSRTAAQCHSHHQKMLAKHGSIKGIIDQAIRSINLPSTILSKSQRSTKEKINFQEGKLKNVHKLQEKLSKYHERQAKETGTIENKEKKENQQMKNSVSKNSSKLEDQNCPINHSNYQSYSLPKKDENFPHSQWNKICQEFQGFVHLAPQQLKEFPQLDPNYKAMIDNELRNETIGNYCSFHNQLIVYHEEAAHYHVGTTSHYAYQKYQTQQYLKATFPDLREELRMKLPEPVFIHPSMFKQEAYYKNKQQECMIPHERCQCMIPHERCQCMIPYEEHHYMIPHEEHQCMIAHEERQWMIAHEGYHYKMSDEEKGVPREENVKTEQAYDNNFLVKREEGLI